MAVRKSEHPDLHAHIEQQNLLRQYDLLTNCIEIGLEKGIDAFDKYTLWALNAAAVSNIAQFGGRFREQPISVGDHIPPHFEKIPDLVDQFISVIHENWDISKSPTELPAFALWRLNWIHPFIEGNGRTARAACYYLLCLKHGGLLPGKKSVPERIKENRAPYYAALREADEHLAMSGQFNVRTLAEYLEDLLEAQLLDS
ncbi:MAG TPA: Fic family protein [Pyrinomonadaceae bacterium]|nr:Fic family protein [Pyrinomonadaceae bacterium]